MTSVTTLYLLCQSQGSRRWQRLLPLLQHQQIDSLTLQVLWTHWLLWGLIIWSRSGMWRVVSNHNEEGILTCKIQASNISDCLPGHSAAVTCVRFMSNERLMTGDEQGMLFLWRMDRTKVCALHHLFDILTHKANIQWRLASKVRAHGKALTSLSTLGDIVVSGSSDSVVKVWEVTISG